MPKGDEPKRTIMVAPWPGLPCGLRLRGILYDEGTGRRDGKERNRTGLSDVGETSAATTRRSIARAREIKTRLKTSGVGTLSAVNLSAVHPNSHAGPVCAALVSSKVVAPLIFVSKEAPKYRYLQACPLGPPIDWDLPKAFSLVRGRNWLATSPLAVALPALLKFLGPLRIWVQLVQWPVGAFLTNSPRPGHPSRSCPLL